MWKLNSCKQLSYTKEIAHQSIFKSLTNFVKKINNNNNYVSHATAIAATL